MKSRIGFLILALLVTLSACRQEDNSVNPYPVWLLWVIAVEEVSDIGIPYAPVRGCPQVIYHVLPNGRDSTVNCFQNTNGVKSWEHIEGDVTVEYHVHCLNYYDSEWRQHTFRESNAVQRPNRDGPEDALTDTVILVPM